MPILEAAKSLLGAGTDLAAGFGAEVLQEALEWLLGGVQAAITLQLIKFLVHIELPIGESLYEVTAPMIGIGGFFLVVGLITSMGDGYREVVAGTDTGPRVIGQVIFRVIGLALLVGSWYWVVPLAVDVANGMTDYVLSDAAVGSALRRTFATQLVFIAKYPMLALITAIAVAIATLVMIVLKFIITLSFACLYVGGPALIGFGALPRIGSMPISMVTRGLVTLTMIPFLWTVIFAAWAGVSAGLFDTVTGSGNIVSALMAPGLFLAGLVMMIGATKKAFAAASHGIPMSAGTRAARIAVGMVAFQGLRNAMMSVGLARAAAAAGAGGGGGGGGGGGSPATPSPNGNGGGKAGGTTGQKLQNNFRRLLDLGSGADAIGQQRGYQAQVQSEAEERRRQQQEERDARQHEQKMDWDEGVTQERTKRAGEVQKERQGTLKRHNDWMAQERSAAIAKVVGNGEYAHRTLSSNDEDAQIESVALRRAAYIARAANPVSEERLRQAGRDLPTADRAAAANLASASIAESSSREEGVARYVERMSTEYAAMEMTDRQREAVKAVVSADPKDVKEVFSKDAERFSASAGHHEHVINQDLFDGNFKAFTDAYQQKHGPKPDDGS